MKFTSSEDKRFICLKCEIIQFFVTLPYIKVKKYPHIKTLGLTL